MTAFQPRAAGFVKSPQPGFVKSLQPGFVKSLQPGFVKSLQPGFVKIPQPGFIKNPHPVFAVCLLASLLLPCLAAGAAPPNIVLVLVDDAGYMDFGGYGGEANTPNIDAIADAGVRFSNYHTSPLCSPSRAMLLTGVDSHKTGMGTIPEMLTKEQAGRPEYAMRLIEGIETIAGKLRAAGYQTYMTGKWHLGSSAGALPNAHGFDRSFALDASGADNWEQKSYMPYYRQAPWFEDGKPAGLPDDFYSSRFIVDRMIDYLSAGDPDRPFFSYLAFQAIHIPVQAPREYTNRYRGVYTAGWDELLQRRHARARELGLIPGDAVPPVMPASLRPWASLGAREQRWFERAMMVNAGMLEAMDFHIGRLVRYLRESGRYQNTVFVITSDNGPEFSLPNASSLFRLWMWRNGYRDDVESLGEKGSMVAIGPEWASAASSPGRLFKMYATEGGTRVPLIIAGPGVLPQQGFNPAAAFVTDVTPTLLSLAGVAASIQNLGEPMAGRSLAPLLDGSAQQVHDGATGMEVSGNAWLIKGDYKLVKNSLPYGDGQWRLYNLGRDPSEHMDLSDARPELKAALVADYEAYAASVGVLPVAANFDNTRQLGKALLARLAADNAGVVIGLLFAFVLAGLWLAVKIARRRQ